MEDAFRTLQPFNRTNSLPSSLTNPAYDIELPPALQETLNAPRQTFGVYPNDISLSNNGKEPTEASAPQNNEGPKTEEISVAPLVKSHCASPPHSIDDVYRGGTQVGSPLPVDSDELGFPQQGFRTSPPSTVAKLQVREVMLPHYHDAQVVPEKVASDNDKPTSMEGGSPELPLPSAKSQPTPATPLTIDQALINGSVDVQKETEKAVNGSTNQPQASKETTNESLLPILTSMELCIAYDPHQMVEWMANYRDCRSNCPVGIAEFIKKHGFMEDNTTTANLTGRSQIQAKATTPRTHSFSGIRAASSFGGDAFFGGKRQGDLDNKDGRVASQGSSFTLNAGVSSSFDHHMGGYSGRSGSVFDKEVIPTGQTALQAMETIWEDRKAIPIAVYAPLRRRGIFGVASKKEIHHMVLSVLNKVTTDAEKFQEVKKELLRLPIPEANAEQLDSIVGVFFKKAVYEQHFSRSYAELMAALCKVPQGQHIIGDKTLSPEYRMRRALLPRCQQMFLSGVQEDENDSAILNEDELTKKRRVMTGNVRFVSELFMCDVIPETIIAFIFLTCCTGSADGTFTMPPAHMPTEVEIDEIIAAAGVVGASFFVKTKKGRDMLPQLLYTLQYWCECHTVSRCRYLLMKEVEKLSLWMTLSGADVSSASTASASQVPSLAAGTLQSPTSVFRLPSLGPHSVSSPSNGGVLEPANVSPKDKTLARVCEPPINRLNIGQSLCSSSGAFPNTSVSVPRPAIDQGGNETPVVSSGSIPAPRSSRNKVGLGICSPPTAGDSLSLGSTNLQLKQQRVPTAGPHPMPVSLPAQTHTKTAPKAETIAKDMALLKNGVVRMSDMLDSWLATYDDILPILVIWADRCLSVVREETNRLMTGELLSLVLQRNESRYQRTQLRGLIFDSLERALNAQLHEDLRLFKFWAQTVLSDPRRVVLDEELLEGGLEYLLECHPSAVRPYLVDVGQWYGYVQSQENHLIASDESSGFLRYRPLICQEISYGNANSPTTKKPQMEEFADVRRNNLEFDIYYTLIHGSPPNIESLFEKLRTSPRLRNDYTLAAEVLSSVLLAEINSLEKRDYLKSCIPLLQITVDGPNRLERELALIAEVYEVCDAFQQRAPPQSVPAKSHILGKLRSSHVVSDESLERVLRFFVERDENDVELSDADNVSVTRPPKQIEPAAEVPEKPALTNAPQHTWVSFDLASSSPAPRKVSSACSAGPSSDRQFHPPHSNQQTEDGGGNRAAFNVGGRRGGGGVVETMNPSMHYIAPPQMMVPSTNLNNTSWKMYMDTNQHQVQQCYRGAGRHNNDARGYHPRNHPRGGGNYDEGRGTDAGATGGASNRRERRGGGRGGRSRGN
ncbi:unnamed protein product [Phytomonas sp. EM1]|nr:unnamed protein product [Phytomonas sp. EM1]|eukprot:CCW65305.1 unnamed protein product [Phytomonas sp. isolate EM1]